jgi:hypothetical protein
MSTQPSVRCKYEQLNLNVDREGEVYPQVLRERKTVDWYWTEKGLMAITFLQFFAFLMIISENYPWPTTFHQWFFWPKLLLLEFGSIAESWQRSYNELAHSIVILLLPVIFFVVYQLLQRHCYDDRYGQVDTSKANRVLPKLRFQKLFWIIFLEVLQLPVWLNFWRLIICDSDRYLILLDPKGNTLKCWTGGHYALIVFGALVVIPCCLVLPIADFIWRRRSVVFADKHLHER